MRPLDANPNHRAAALDTTSTIVKLISPYPTCSRPMFVFVVATGRA